MYLYVLDVCQWVSRAAHYVLLFGSMRVNTDYMFYRDAVLPKRRPTAIPYAHPVTEVRPAKQTVWMCGFMFGLGVNQHEIS